MMLTRTIFATVLLLETTLLAGAAGTEEEGVGASNWDGRGGIVVGPSVVTVLLVKVINEVNKDNSEILDDTTDDKGGFNVVKAVVAMRVVTSVMVTKTTEPAIV